MKTMKTWAAVAAAVILAASCSKDDDDNPNPTPVQTGQVELTGDVSTRTLTADKKYLLKGQVFVRDGETLTIEPGTVILGDKRTRGVLVIDRGGKIMAEGTAAKPIVFTSNQEPGVRDRGDWGGVVMLGNANVNQNNPAIEGITPEVNFGSTNNSANDNESSGVLRYVRIEFGGIELQPNNETNSLTMGGVGRGTEIEYVQTSFGGDDGFEWFGGVNNCKYLISSAIWDDDMDCDYGWSGNVQHALVIRYPGFADQSTSNAFECDNGPNDNDVEPYTTGTFSNVTVIGPIKEGDKVSNSNFGYCMDLRRRTAISIFNTVFTGFPTGLRMNQPSVYEQYTTHNRGVLANNIMITPNNEFAAGSGVEVQDVANYFTQNNTHIPGPQTTQQLANLGIKSNVFYGSNLSDKYPTDADFTVTSGTLTSGADFSHAKFSESNRSSFFDTNVDHIGGFAGTDWTAGWAEFDPVNRVY